MFVVLLLVLRLLAGISVNSVAVVLDSMLGFPWVDYLWVCCWWLCLDCVALLCAVFVWFLLRSGAVCWAICV